MFLKVPSDIKLIGDEQQAFGALIGRHCERNAGNLVGCMQICDCRFMNSETQFLLQQDTINCVY